MKEVVNDDQVPGAAVLLNDRELDALCLEKFQTVVVGQFHSKWKATEIFVETIVGKPELGIDMCVDLMFRPV